MLYYFMGICGSAMASAAVMMKRKGHRVLGSDHSPYPPATWWLQQEWIEVLEGYRGENIPPDPYRVVIGNALSRGNPEVEAVLDRHLHYISLPELLREELIRGRLSCVVSGTHGKTTTASMLAWFLESAGRRPGFFIGGMPQNFGTGCREGGGEMVVLEGDEYDSAFFDKRAKFLHYMPDCVIINAIEFDHADIYKDLDEILLAFRRLLALIPSRGLVVANADDPGVMGLARGAYCPVVTFGEGQAAQWRATELDTTREGMRFRILVEGQDMGVYHLPLWGGHNVRNALAAAAAARWLGLSMEEVRRGMETFAGVSRRMELKGVARGVAVYDDFAHHPGAIRATLQAARLRHPAARIWAVFEPRSHTTRRNLLHHELARALSLSHGTVVGGVYRPEAIPSGERLDPQALVRDIGAYSAAYIPDVDDIVRYLVPRLSEGDIVVVMSNGSFDGIHEKLLRGLELGEKECGYR